MEVFFDRLGNKRDEMMRNNSINSLFYNVLYSIIRRNIGIKSTISLEGLLALIHGLSLSASNKRWLGEKLIEEARVWKDEDFPEVSADEMVKEIRESRKFKKKSIT